MDTERTPSPKCDERQYSALDYLSGKAFAGRTYWTPFSHRKARGIFESELSRRGRQPGLDGIPTEDD